jgi:hypothetical protein
LVRAALPLQGPPAWRQDEARDPRHYKAARDLFKREFEAAQKDKAGTNTFVDRMRDVVNVDKATKRR